MMAKWMVMVLVMVVPNDGNDASDDSDDSAMKVAPK